MAHDMINNMIYPRKKLPSSLLHTHGFNPASKSAFGFIAKIIGLCYIVALIENHHLLLVYYIYIAGYTVAISYPRDHFSHLNQLIGNVINEGIVPGANEYLVNLPLRVDCRT